MKKKVPSVTASLFSNCTNFRQWTVDAVIQRLTVKHHYKAPNTQTANATKQTLIAVNTV